MEQWIHIYVEIGGKNSCNRFNKRSRTMIFNIKKNCWDKKLLKLLKIPNIILPDIKNSADNFGIQQINQ